jgi:hypothetical protein
MPAAESTRTATEHGEVTMAVHRTSWFSEKVLRTVVTFVVVFVVLMSHDAGGLTVGEGRKNG